MPVFYTMNMNGRRLLCIVILFILAGGLGLRAEPLSRFKPKPAFPLNGVPLVTLLLEQLRHLGCTQGFINLHHLGAQVASAAKSAHISSNRRSFMRA